MTRIIPALFAFSLLPLAASAAETVSVPPFKSIELRGGGHITLRHGDNQHVSIVNGSTKFTAFHIEPNGRLVIDACNESCPHRYDLDIEIVTPVIEGVAISGGGHIAATSGFGTQAMITAEVSGGGDIDLRSINAQRVNASVSGGGDMRLHAEKSLMAAVDGGGAITYWGHPTVTQRERRRLRPAGLRRISLCRTKGFYSLARTAARTDAQPPTKPKPGYRPRPAFLAAIPSVAALIPRRYKGAPIKKTGE